MGLCDFVWGLGGSCSCVSGASFHIKGGISANMDISLLTLPGSHGKLFKKKKKKRGVSSFFLKLNLSA